MPYDPKSGQYTMEMPDNRTQALLMVSVLGSALRSTLEALAAQNGNKRGPWFDELSAHLLQDAKSTIAEGIAIGDDAKGVGLGVEVLQATLDAVARKLTV